MKSSGKKKLVVLPLLAAAVAGWYVFSRHSADNGDGAIRISGNIEATDVEWAAPYVNAVGAADTD